MPKMAQKSPIKIFAQINKYLPDSETNILTAKHEIRSSCMWWLDGM